MPYSKGETMIRYLLITLIFLGGLQNLNSQCVQPYTDPSMTGQGNVLSDFDKEPKKDSSQTEKTVDTLTDQENNGQGEDQGAETPNPDGYNTENVINYKGIVQSLRVGKIDNDTTTHLLASVKGENNDSVLVSLGSADYLKSLNYSISILDSIEVQGSQVDFQGKPLILSSLITKGENVIILRDESGKPLWNAEDLRNAQ